MSKKMHSDDELQVIGKAKAATLFVKALAKTARRLNKLGLKGEEGLRAAARLLQAESVIFGGGGGH